MKKNQPIQPPDDEMPGPAPLSDQLDKLFSTLGELVYQHGELTAQLAGIEGAIEECRSAIANKLK